MKKNILLVFPGFSVSVDEGAKHRLNSFINEYSKLGFSITVLAFCKQGLFLKNRNQYLNSKAKWILFPYILPMSRNIFLFNILLMYLKFFLALISRLKKFDIIQMEVFSIGSWLCRKNSYYITDFHGDSFHEFIEMNGISDKHWYAKAILRIQRDSLKFSNYCICVSENLRIQLETNTQEKIDNYGIVSCGVDVSCFEGITAPSEYISKLSNRLVLGYSGGLQKWQNIDKIIQLVIRLREIDSSVYLMICTNHSIEPYEKLLLQLGRENYTVLSLKAGDVPSYLKLFDAGFLLRDNWILNKVSSPTKICEYLAAGVPVICTRFSGDFTRSVFSCVTGFILNETNITQEELIGLYKWLHIVKTERIIVEEKCRMQVVERLFNTEFLVAYSKMLF